MPAVWFDCESKFKSKENNTVVIYSSVRDEPCGVWFAIARKAKFPVLGKIYDQVILIDCGLGFAPEITFDSEVNLYNAEAEMEAKFLCGLVANSRIARVVVLGTHGHLDHFTGLNIFSKMVNIEFYGTWFTNECIDRHFTKQKEHINFKMHELCGLAGHLEIDEFILDWFRMSHSCPGAVSTIIQTKRNDKSGMMKILLLGEMRLPDLPFEIGTTDAALKVIEDNGPYDWVFYDGLYLNKTGNAVGEEAVRIPVRKLLCHSDIPGHILTSYISSKVGLTMIFMEEAYAAGWAFLSYGTTMNDIINLSRIPGWLPPKEFPEGEEYRIFKVATGSQAEQGSIMKRLVEGDATCPLKTDEKTTVLWSQGTIPDNIRRVRWMLKELAQKVFMILIPNQELRRLKLVGSANIVSLEEFLGEEELIQMPSGHEQFDGWEFILSKTKTPRENCYAYQVVEPRQKQKYDPYLMMEDAAIEKAKIDREMARLAAEEEVRDQKLAEFEALKSSAADQLQKLIE